MKDLHASAGISDAKVFRIVDSENTVVVLADIPDLPTAQAWERRVEGRYPGGRSRGLTNGLLRCRPARKLAEARPHSMRHGYP